MNDPRRRIREIVAHGILSNRGLVELEHFARIHNQLFGRPLEQEEARAMEAVGMYTGRALKSLRKNNDKARIERMCSVV